MIALLLTLLGCGNGLPDQIEDCPDEACRQSWVLNAYDRDPKEAVAALDRVQDPIERVVIVTRMVETWPGRTRELCSKLTSGPPRTRCERINGRPHLQSDPPPRVTTTRSAGGPSTSSLPEPSPERSPYYNAAPSRGPCKSRQEPHVCYATQALRLALTDAGMAASACAGIDDQKWSSECLFSAAEMMVNAQGMAGLTGANDLCVSAVPFVANCLAHVTVMLAKSAPDATESGAEAWAPMVAPAEAIRAYWAERSPESVDLYIDRYWSEVMSLAYAGTPEVTGGPLDGLPPEAVPQIRAAAAYRLMELKGPGAYADLAAWTDALEAALAARSSSPHRPPPPAPPDQRRMRDAQTVVPNNGVSLFQGKKNFWEKDQAGDEVYRAAYYWGTARRAIAEDPRADLSVCVLEAAAQIGDAARGKGDRATFDQARTLVSDGLNASDPAVRWTAERLLKAALPK